MGIFEKIFRKKEAENIAVFTNEDFWNWFLENEKTFFKVVKNEDQIEANLFDIIGPQLDKLREGYYYLTGMFTEDIAELIITVDGNLKNIAFAENLIKEAPKLENWRFTALKPASGIDDFAIQMAGFNFDKETISFYSNENPEYPDEVNLTLVHQDFNAENEAQITNGVYIFLDNFLGELNFSTSIDELNIVGKYEAGADLIPISKLRDFLLWREKEFVEKYEGARIDTDEDSFSMFEASLNNGLPLLAVINSTLLNWDKKASHPYI